MGKLKKSEIITANEMRCSCGQKSSCTVESILTIDDRGQMVLPKDVRERAGIKPGDKLALISWEKEGSICCLALMKTENLSGMVKEVLSPILNDTGAE
ncbi:AbrB/MazE/SpoVT family DNA-binding domain-containing protein [Methanospirillum sp. J.3.6.1-F.2.7.3]|uniref:AbrB/MazE/SpoVT family DNA-binding domain-containing protein n=1 Tax=Methanospirillum purgamenti TaxID=2834276 RepID=A0A8E7AYN4_9EURY|nr:MULTISPECIES: HgcAB-associated protein [Methanospirillum]MDX8551709.1 HgcAB-associated protein [Methanospirillum hungatei]QVV87833.1 AbrB/MazE/SpoVT family DNA-binding domain-containing protein [Methanospirillum sp. J.3.6.1-F.2.7.3]